MSNLIGSGLRIEEALATIAKGQPAKVAAVMHKIRFALTEGRTLADALGDHPASFWEYYCASVRAGEHSGHLDKVLDHLADFVENRARSRQTVVLALRYPMLLGLVSHGIVTMPMIYAVPDMVNVFTARSAALPIMTRVLIGASAWVRSPGLIVAIALIVCAPILIWWLRQASGRRRIDRALDIGWLTRRLVQRMNATQFAGTLATLVQSGVPLVVALEAAEDAMPKLHIRATVAAMTHRVRQGNPRSRAMEGAACFPPSLIVMVASGEANGKLGDALDRAARDQQRDLDAWVRAMVALVEPGILLIMGGLVMTIVLAILLPIVSMTSLVSG